MIKKVRRTDFNISSLDVTVNVAKLFCLSLYIPVSQVITSSFTDILLIKLEVVYCKNYIIHAIISYPFLFYGKYKV